MYNDESSGLGTLSLKLSFNRHGKQELEKQGFPSWSLGTSRPAEDIVHGSRDPQLALAPDLNYSMAAKILLLLENLK